MHDPHPTRLTLRMSIDDKALIDRAVRMSGRTQQDWATRVLCEAAEGQLVDPAARSRLLKQTHMHVVRTSFLLRYLLMALGHTDLLESGEVDLDAMMQRVTQTQG